MSALHVLVDVSGGFKDLIERNATIIHVKGGNGMHIGRLPAGMESGRSSVAIRIDLPDGSAVIGEVSMANFLNCARIFNAAEEKP